MWKLGAMSATALVVVFLSTPVLASHVGQATMGSKKAKCHELLGSKHLKGDTYKAEWSKCMEDPDMYK